ncbi:MULTISPECIES: NHLP bacteriocin export ABC transporter permease/ATPase subunit [unclassified Bradyrhizobium]
MLHEPPHRIAVSDAAAIDRSGAVIIEACGLRVEAGTADLYLDWPGRAGRRRRLVTLGRGEIALPITVPSGAAEMRLIAFPAPAAHLSTFAIDAFLASLDDGEASAGGAAEAWIERTIRTVSVPLSGSPAVLDQGDTWLEPGHVVRPAQGLLWVTIAEGTILTDLRGAGPDGPGTPPIPVSAASGGIATDQGATIDCRTSAALAAERSLARAILGHQERFARALAAADADRKSEEAALIIGKATRDRTVVAAVIEPLVTRSIVGAPRNNSLAAAFRAVAEAAAITLPSTPPPEAAEINTPPSGRQLAALAAWAGIRLRRIRLKPGWWRQGGHPVLGFRREDGAPVALIAGTGWRGGYHIWEDGRRRRVGAQPAADLAEYGYVLQRRLPDAPINGRGLLSFAFPLARPMLAAVLMLGLAGCLLGLVTPVATEILLENVIPAASRSELLQLAIGIAALGLGGVVFELVRSFLLLRLATLLNTDLEGAVWDRLLRLPAGFFRNYASGDLALRAAAINQMRDAVSGTVIGSLLSSVFSVSSLALILYYNWRLALVAIALVIVQLGVMIAINLRALTLKRQALDTEGRLQALALQLIQGISKLKVAGAEARGFARWAPIFIKRREFEFRQSSLSAGFSAFGTAFGTAAVALLIGIVGLGGIEIGIGRFVAFNAAYGQFMSATLALAGALPALLSLRLLYGRAAPLLAATPENLGSRGATHDLRGGIEVSNVVFRYRADGPAVLGGVSISARPGEFIGIVGASGSGKSTLMRVLLGFETPERGSVFFDDQELANLDLHAVRRQMGVVLQSSRTTSGSLLDNILNGAVLTEADAWEAARLAGLDDDIRAMPMRMHTFVGEDALLLSGGQRQRLLIARAVVRRPRILLFDEATSALDNRTQQIVSEGLKRLDATRIVVAHRLSTVQNADRIYVLEAGKVVEEGSYQELLDRGGLFAELAFRQTA